MKPRINDSEARTYFRTERICRENGDWHFLTRDGCVGPFASRVDAEQALSRYVDELVTLHNFQKSRELSSNIVPITQGRIRITPLAYSPAGETSEKLELEVYI